MKPSAEASEEEGTHTHTSRFDGNRRRASIKVKRRRPWLPSPIPSTSKGSIRIHPVRTLRRIKKNVQKKLYIMERNGPLPITKSKTPPPPAPPTNPVVAIASSIGDGAFHGTGTFMELEPILQAQCLFVFPILNGKVSGFLFALILSF